MSHRKILVSLVLVVMVTVQAAGAVRLVAGTGAPALHATSLDMTGAIAITDPFGACHADNYDLMAELGVKMNRKDITWTEVQPTNTTWNWNGWDARVAQLKARNMTALPILDYGNPNVQGEPHDGHRISTEEDIQKWLHYVNQCVERYHVNDSGYIEYWEIWNEANLDKFWSGSDEEFFELQRRTAENVSAGYPGVKILSNGIAGHSPEYLDAMFSHGAMENIDILAFHPYSGSNYDSLERKINEVKVVASKHGFDGELWITEVGMSTQFDPEVPGFDARYREALELQASLVPKIYATSLANDIKHVTWYCLEDFNRGGEFLHYDWTWGEANFGLLFAGSNSYKPEPYSGDRIKPAGYAYKALAHVLNWSTYVPSGVQKTTLTPSLEKIQAYYFLAADGRVVLVAWNSNGQVPVHVSFPLPAGSTIETFSGPSYKPGEATGFLVSSSGGRIGVEATMGSSPFIFVISLPENAEPVPVILSGSWNVFDAIMVVGIPVASIAAICVVVARSTRLKTTRRK